MIDAKKGMIAWFARNSVAANLLMVIIIAIGIYSAMTIKKQMFPDITLDVISVRVAYPGAAPQEVESGIIDKIEEVLEDVDGLEKVTSTAVEGSASVSIEVDSGYAVQEVLDEVKMRIDSISSFPEQIEKPTVYRQRINSDVIWIAIHGEADERGLKELAKDVRDELKLIDGVNKVDILGTRDYEVAIEVSEHRLQEFNLTFEQVVDAVRNSSIDLPGGSIKSDNGDILLRTKGQAYYGEDFDSIVLVTRPDGTRLTLKDIALVRDGFTEDANYSVFDGRPAVSIRVSAVGEDNVLKIAESVKEYVEKKKKDLPDSVGLDHWGDSSYYLNGRLDLMINNMLGGAILVLLVLALFLELKVAFWVMIGIPVCFLGAFALMPLEIFDVSVNMISLFAFILVLGIVVDDAIIIGESAYSEVEKNGHTTDNVVTGAKKVATPATFGVLTTIAAFSPMLMVSGPMGKIWESIAYVVVFCLVFSLVESKLILPAHLSKMKVNNDRKAGPLKRLRLWINEKLNAFVNTKYRNFLDKVIHMRYTALAAFLGMFILVFGVINGGFVRWVFFPNLPSDFVSGEVTMEEGTSSAATNNALFEMEKALIAVDKRLFEETGQHLVKHRIAFDQGASSGTIFVELQKSESQEVDGFEVIRLWRENMPEVPGVKNFQFNGSINGGGGSDIALQFKGNSLDQLRLAASELKEILGTFEGVADIKDSMSGGKEEIVLRIKPEAEALGLTLSALASQVRNGFYGAEAQRIQRDGEEIKVMIRYPKEERHSVGNLENMKVRTPNGDEVPFYTVAEFDMEPSFSSITRINGERSITVTAAADKAVVEPYKVIGELMSKTVPELRAKYPGITVGLEGASADEEESMAELGAAALLAMFGIYALLAIPLKSYSQPIIIMSVIPFGLIGAIIGHLVFGLSLSIMSIFGIIALSGVVVNDSLIMVDFVNRAREQGVAIRRAAVEAGIQRFRAIILTSLTTFFGLLPIVLEKSLQAKIVIPMAVSLAFGIVFATLITLVLIPALYVILDDVKNMFSRIGSLFSRSGFKRNDDKTIEEKLTKQW